MDNDTRKLLGITDPNIEFSDHQLLSNHKQVFPNVRVVYDRFHIIKCLNDLMNHVRIHFYNRLKLIKCIAFDYRNFTTFKT